jgi:hypothetical protein
MGTGEIDFGDPVAELLQGHLFQVFVGRFGTAEGRRTLSEWEAGDVSSFPHRPVSGDGADRSCALPSSSSWVPRRSSSCMRSMK